MGVEDPTVADGASASMSSRELSDLSGRVLRGRYQASRKVGAGSMGDVYEGIDLHSSGRVAIKVLKPERAVREVFRHRFLREAKSAVLIDHPNVVDVLDYGETEDGLLFIAMEFLEGEDLSTFLDRAGRLSWPHCVGVLQQIAAALAAAHDRGVVHRDVKPSNILLRQAGSGELIVKLVDFGVAKLENNMVSRVLTKAADVVGTVLYMSPEQAEGHRADLRSDVYAFGVTAYQMVTGQVPFPGRDLFKVMSAHLSEPPPDPRPLATEMPPWAATFVLRCLEKKPDARYQSMHDVLAVLAGTSAADMVSQARPGTPIASPEDAIDDQHPPLAASEPIPLDPHAPTMAGASELLTPPPSDDFDEEAPTTYFQSPGSRANAPTSSPELLAPAPAAAPPLVPTQVATPVRIDPASVDTPSPFAQPTPSGMQTQRAAAVVFDEDVSEGRTSGTVYVLLVVGVLVVVAGLVVVVAA